VTSVTRRKADKSRSSPPQQAGQRLRRQQLESNFKIGPTPQGPSKKTSTRAFYNDGFDVVNPPSQRKSRLEDFDEVVSVSVLGSTALTLTDFQVNPGLPGTFPRLSKFAALYEKYLFKKLEFYFQHDVSQFAAQGSKGLAVLSALYDASQPGPDTKQQQEMTDPHVIFMPSQNALLKIDPKRLHPRGEPLYIRSDRKFGGTDIRLYDACHIFLSTQGMTDGSEIGELHCRGTVEFFDEIVDGVTRPPINQSISSANTVGISVSPASGSWALCDNLILQINGLDATIEQTSSIIDLAPGNYNIAYRVINFFSGLATQSQSKVTINNVDLVGTDSVETFSSGSRTVVTHAGNASTSFGAVNANSNHGIIEMQTQGTFSTGAMTTHAFINITAV